MPMPRSPAETPPAGLAPLAVLPVFLALDGKRAIVAGDGPGAAWKARLLAACGARVEVFATDPSPDLLAAPTDVPAGVITLRSRAWRAEDFDEAAIAVGAFDDAAAAARFAAAARHAGVPANLVDRPDLGVFQFGAIVNRSPLVIGIATGGAAPALSQAVRSRLEGMLPAGLARWAAAARGWRGRVGRTIADFAGRRAFWQRFADRALAAPDAVPDEDSWRALLDGDAAAVGSVVLVGAGPGDPELLTLKAMRALRGADVILYDDLVAPEILDFARREARRLLVGKTGHGPSCRQEEINRLLVRLAREGKRVVRLKGGCPLVFGRAAEEVAACREAGIAVEIVPGISAAQGAAAVLGRSLTDRDAARRLQFVTGHDRHGGLPADADWHAVAGGATTTAVYMAGRTMGGMLAAAMAAGLDPATPALAVFDATRPTQAVVAGTAADLADRVAAAPHAGACLVLIGRALAGMETAEIAETGAAEAAPTRISA